MHKGYRVVKRIVDFMIACIAAIVLSPLFFVLVIAIRMDSPGPIFFRQKRIGMGKTHFHILKFRTMRSDTPADRPTHLLEDPEYWITRMGHFLRKYSLDELPQIMNILKGEMSIVGPRPALWNQDDLIAERDRYGANDVPVGLTGWAQINGRDELPIPQKAKLDGEYAQNFGPWMDIRCFFGTVRSVFQAKGVKEGGVSGAVEPNHVEAEKKIQEKR